MDKWQGWKNEINEETVEAEVAAKSFAEACGLKQICGKPEDKMCLCTANINRPGLLLAGFEDYFAEKRIQVLGNAETYFMSNLSEEQAINVYERLFEKGMPCVIIARDILPTDSFKACAEKHNVPVFITEMPTTKLINDLTGYLNELIARSQYVHGVLMEVSGTGVLIVGHSGMGKSETALELIHRGHRLVADDAVIVRNVSNTLIGTAPRNIRYFMEVRGIGIIDVRRMFGIGSVLYDKNIELVIELEKWKDDIEYDRLGLEEQKYNLLGVSVPKLLMPVMPGRNLAIVVEVACRNQRLKQMGFDATDELLSHHKF